MARVPHTVGRVDVSGRLEVDVACGQCGYNLRGLALGGACPECGYAIEPSARGQWLRYAEPAWVEKLMRGATLLLCGMAGQIVWWVAWLAGGAMWDGQGRLRVALPMLLLIGGAVVAGTWRVTRPRGSGAAEGSGAWLRSVARIGLGGGYLLAASCFALTEEVLDDLIWLSAAVIPLAGAGSIALLLHIRRLALRLPDRGLAGEALMVACGVGAGLGLLLVAALLTVAATIISQGLNWGGWAAAVLCWLAGLAAAATLAVSGIWGMIVVGHLRVELGEAAWQGRRALV